MPRHLVPEILDHLPPRDARAVRSRRDLRLLNRLMGQAGLMASLLEKNWKGKSPLRLVELGAGDGTFLLSLARSLAHQPGPLDAALVDRQPAVSLESRRRLEELGWTVTVVQSDVFDWLEKADMEKGTVIMANLFLHHFADEALRELFQLAAGKAQLFAAGEPRRAALPLAASRLVGLLGCNSVTRHDAPASVRAGFVGNELSGLWPRQAGWRFQEGEFGLFSHYFMARRTAP